MAKNYCASGISVGGYSYICGSATATACTKGSYTSGGYSRQDLIEADPSSKEFAAITKAANGVESSILQNKISVSGLLANLPTNTTSASLKMLKNYADAKLGPNNYWFTFIVHDSATEKSLGMSCKTGEQEGTQYVEFANMLLPGHASVYPICAPDYRPAVLDKTITPVIKFVTRVFSAPTVGSESVEKVVIQRADGTDRTLQPIDYSVAASAGNATVTLDPAIPLSDTDRVVIVLANSTRL